MPRRRAVYAPHGAVATSQPLAAAAGLAILREGGNAVDAAVAMAAALAVVEPTSNGIGSDLMAIVSQPGGEVAGLIGSGRAPAALDAQAALRDIAPHGWHAATVPAAPRAWFDLSERLGRLPFARLLQPAIGYARDGFPLSPLIAEQWRRGAEVARRLDGAEFAGFASTFLPEGFEPAPGARFANPDLAATLERVAESGGEDFYAGEIARRIAAFAEATGGALRAGDLAAHAAEWVEPVAVDFRGHRVYELPPPTQGAVALVALGLLEQLGAARSPEEREHRAIEAVKHAFAHALPVVADGEEARAWLHSMLHESTLAEEVRTLGDIAAPGPEDARLDAGTVYLAAADRDGGTASLIQSNFMDFGTYVVVPGTGVLLANRGWCFSRERRHPNAPHPKRRPYNTIIPGLLADGDGRPLGPFGVMGGFMQPQGHVQFLTRLLEQGLDPQAALAAPRWRFLGGRSVACEPEFPADIRETLARRGHRVRVEEDRPPFGRGQAILRTETGWVAGSDDRGDGCALGY